MTAAEAVTLLADMGLEGVWQWQESAGTEPTCPSDRECPIGGIPVDTMGCVRINVYELPRYEPPQEEPNLDVHISWFSKGDSDNPDGVYLNYSVRRPLYEVEAAL